MVESKPPELFVIKVWVEKRNTIFSPTQWRGQITRTATGERHYIKAVSELKQFIEPYVTPSQSCYGPLKRSLLLIDMAAMKRARHQGEGMKKTESVFVILQRRAKAREAQQKAAEAAAAAVEAANAASAAAVETVAAVEAAANAAEPVDIVSVSPPEMMTEPIPFEPPAAVEPPPPVVLNPVIIPPRPELKTKPAAVEPDSPPVEDHAPNEVNISVELIQPSPPPAPPPPEIVKPPVPSAPSVSAASLPTIPKPSAEKAPTGVAASILSGFTASAAARLISPLPSNTVTSAEEALARLLQGLRGALPANVGGLPSNGVSSVQLREVPLGIGNRRGVEGRAPFAVTELKGGRLDALVRFQVWGNNADAVETAIQQIQAQLLAAKTALFVAGYLKVVAQSSSLVEPVGNAPMWRKTADYQVLYEFHFADEDGARGLIARIPVDMGEYGQFEVRQDEMVVWSKNPLLPLTVHSGKISALYAVSYLPVGWNGDGVTITLTQSGVTHSQSFPTVRAFLAAFTPDGSPLQLNERQYQVSKLTFPNATFSTPIQLMGGSDVFRVQYAANAFVNPADEPVVYLKVVG